MPDCDDYDTPLHRYDQEPFINPEAWDEIARLIRNGELPELKPDNSALRNAIFAVALFRLAGHHELSPTHKSIGPDQQPKK